MQGPDHHLLELLSSRRYPPADECPLVERHLPTDGATPAEGQERINSSSSSLAGTNLAAASSADRDDKLRRRSEDISMDTLRLRSTRRRVGRPRLDARGAAVLSEVLPEKKKKAESDFPNRIVGYRFDALREPTDLKRSHSPKRQGAGSGT